MSIYQMIPDTGAEAPFSHLIKHKGGAPAPATPPPPPPPPTATTTEVQLQRREMLKNANKRKGLKSTLLEDGAGGGLGGSGGGASGGPRATLLGG